MKKLLIILIFAMCMSSLAQQSQVQVPDVTGLNVAQAAAVLNQAGLNLGEQTAVDAVEDAPRNTVVAQGIQPDTMVDYGTAVALVVVLPTNARLIYDENSITMYNLTDEVMDTPNILFSATEGSTASFNLAQLGGTLEVDECFQLWSVDRGDAEIVNGCETVNGRTLTTPADYFWSQASGTTQFAIMENGIQRAVCPAASVGTEEAPLYCDFYLEGGGVGFVETDYIYLVYSDNALAMINTSQDQWMPTDQTTIYNYNSGLTIQGVAGTFGDPEVLREDHRVGLGYITRLAPNQCIVYTVQGSGVTEPPEACDVVAQRSLDGNVVAWANDFEAESSLDGTIQDCPDSITDELVRCTATR